MSKKEPCDICGGTGKVYDRVYQGNSRVKKKGPYRCMRCGGSGEKP